MNLNLLVNGKIRNYIFAGGLAVTLISLLAVLIIGADQNKSYISNYGQYQQAINLMGDRKYAQALQVFQGLDMESQNSYQVQYMEAFCASQIGDYPAAAALMKKAGETRPALLQDEKYLERYGVILYQLGEYEPARFYLQRSIKYSADPATAENYISEIDRKLGTGGRP